MYIVTNKSQDESFQENASPKHMRIISVNCMNFKTMRQIFAQIADEMGVAAMGRSADVLLSALEDCAVKWKVV